MKCLSIRQPWAWLIVNGSKDVENRTWFCGYRGNLLIHAGKAWDENYDPKRPEAFQAYLDDLHARRVLPKPLRGVIYTREVLPPPEEMGRGGIVGTAWMDGCVRNSEELRAVLPHTPWYEGAFGFILRHAVPWDFIPCRGRLGLFDVSGPIIDRVFETALQNSIREES